jgi:hypothetical protein
MPRKKTGSSFSSRKMVNYNKKKKEKSEEENNEMNDSHELEGVENLENEIVNSDINSENNSELNAEQDHDSLSISSVNSNQTPFNRKRKRSHLTPFIGGLNLQSPQPPKRRSDRIANKRTSMPPPTGTVTRSLRSVSTRRSLSPVQQNIINPDGFTCWELPDPQDPLLIIDQYPLDLNNREQSAEAFQIQNSSLAQARELQRIINAHNNRRFRNEDLSKHMDFFLRLCLFGVVEGAFRVICTCR